MKARVLFFFMLTAGSLLRAQLPTGATVVAGDVNVTHAANAMTVTQASRNAIVNWQSFNLGADATFRLQQSGADAAMLARVVGNDPSKLLGSLKADGKLFLINPKGIVVGQGAVIDTAAFLASTLDVSDDNFLRGGELTFKGNSAADVVNYGKITAREGNIFLFAHTVKNAGEIDAAKGTVGMGAGTEVLLASPDAAGFVIRTNLPATTEKTGVENSGVIAAGQAQLEAAGGSIYDLAVNQSGVVRATGSEIRNGRVLLTANGGTVGVSGEITAQNKNGSGGEILVGGDYRGKNSAIANAARTVVTATAKLDASAANDTAKAGRVIVWADEATRFLGSLKATGAGGGFAEVSGKRYLDFNPRSVVQLGKGGTLLLDPEALIISSDANDGTSTSGTNPFTFTVTTEPATLNVMTLQNQLAASNVILDTSTSPGDITFKSALIWSSDHSLTVRSGNNINLNADITATGANSTLALYTGLQGRHESGGELGFPELRGDATLAADATIQVAKLIYGANALSNPGEGYTFDTPVSTGRFWTEGDLQVGTFELDLSGGRAGVSSGGLSNSIRTFRATGSHPMGYVWFANGNGDLDVVFDNTTTDSFFLQFVSSGKLTVQAGSKLSFERESIISLASTGGAFVNQAGASLFSGNPQFLIYSTTTSATQKGGLVGTDIFNHAYDENDWFDDGVSRFFFTALSGAPVLTYQADSFTRKYGAANPGLTFTRTGLVNGVTDDVTGAPTLSATATQNSGVGPYAINIGLGTLASNNYDFDFVNGTLTIEKAPLVVTANDKTRRINLDNPAFDARFAGFVLGETQAALGGTLAFATEAAQASPAGTYAITPSGLTSSNYAISFLPGTLTLTATSSLLITANNFNRTYGAANPTFTANYSGFVGNETEAIVSGLQFSTLATQSSGVGTYTVTPFGATAAGYDITYAPGTLTIDRASLTISVPNQSRTYGATNNLTVNYNGLVNGDTSSVVTGLSLATSATPTSNVGTYGITASGAAAANYSILYAQGSLSVTPAPITITLNNASRRYGDADPVFTFSIGGLQNSDSESLINVGTISSLANANSGVGSYGLMAFPWTTSGNYSVPTQVTGSMTITPRPLTITANNFTRVYGDANPAFTATFAGLASFDTTALFGNIGLTTQATQSSGVGNWGITFPTVANANYAITSQFGTLAITPASLTFLPLIELSRVYGRANPSLVLPEVGGLKLSDTVSNLGLAFDAPALNANVGTYAYRLTTANPNYSLGTGATGEFRVTPAPLTVAIGSAGRVYGDETPINYDLRVTGLAFDDSASSVVGVFDPTEARTDVGTYTIESRLLDTNYFINSATNGSLVISPRVLTLTAADRTRVYGDINPFFFGSITGFLPGDSELNIITNLGYVTNATQASSVGSYWIRPSAQTTTANYIINPVDGALSITRAPLSVTIANASRTYGQANPMFSAASAQGLKNQDTTASLGLTFSTNATTSSDVGFYTILGQSSSANYTVNFDPGVLTINRASAIIAANTASRIFGNLFTSNPFSLTFTGFLAADEAVARGNWQLTFTDDATLAPGGHAIGFSAANVLTTAALSKNYDISLQAGMLNVTTRPLTITVPDMKFLLGSVVPATIDFGTPDLPAGSPVFTVVGQRTSADGKTTIVPEIVPGPGVTRSELDRYFTFELKPGAVSFTFDPQDVDLNHQLRLTLNPNDTPINRDNTTTNETIEVDTPQKLNLTVNPYVPFDTQPLTKADYANYFSGFASTTEAVKTALAGGYSEFLTGKGKSGSAYEGMTEAARQMLADWMSGSVSTADLSALIAAGDAEAASAFGFILPTLVDQTRAKNVADMTMMDRQILGRLADLTEKRNTQTILLAQQKYAAMLEANAKKAEMNGLGSILLGPGDFKALVADASNEALTNYITATVGASAITGAAGGALMSIPAVVTSLFPFAVSASTTAASIGGPAIAVSMAVVLAVRATQISESINNENDYNALINSWKVGQEITSLAQLKSPAMNQDLKLSTLMLSAELFSSTP